MGRSTADSHGEWAVSIVIVHYRSPGLLAKCLRKIEEARLDLSCEILIVDNAPLDTSAAELAAKHGAVYLHNARNIGYGRAVNQGMSAARGRHYLILNPDVEIKPGSIEALCEYMDTHPSAGICGPKLFSTDGSLQYSARTCYTPKIILLRRTPLGKLFPNARALREHLMMDWDHNDARDVDWMLGGALMVRPDAVTDVGGMDERFFLYFEDVDWCSRMHRRGWRVVYVPQAEMVHAHQRVSARGFLSPGQRMHIGSALRFYEKWSMVLYFLKRKSTGIRALATVLTDLVMLSAAFLAAYATRYVLGSAIPEWSAMKPVLGLGVYVRVVAFANLVAIGTFYFLGLYRGEIWRDRWSELLQLIKGVSITSLVAMALTFLITTRALSRFTILLTFPYSLLLLVLAREVLRQIVAGVRGQQLQMKRLAVFASREQIEKLKERFQRHGTFGYEPVYLPYDGGEQHPREGHADPVEQRIAFLENERIAEVAVFEGPEGGGFMDRLIPKLLGTGIPVIYVPRRESFFLEARRVGDFMGFGAVSLGGRPRPVASWAKRMVDMAVAAILLLLGLPWHLIRLMILRGSAVTHCPVVGRKGSVFGLRVYLEERGLVGRMRVLSYYPSLINILLGDMSIVGLAPLTPRDWELAQEDYRLNPPDAPVGLIHEGPGVTLRRTELAEVELAQLLHYNHQYVRNWSLSEDFRILLNALRGARVREGGEL
ncbi:MAG: glycosyltransferase [Candidatus Eisenbacteria sp.]|nr:glycosyltransferase [Candidatus Eisenbacteria bacterium]